MTHRLLTPGLSALGLLMLTACGGADPAASGQHATPTPPTTKAVTADPLPEATPDAINAEGIRGDVLAAALGRATTITGDDGQLLFSPARPWEGPPSSDGSVRGIHGTTETLTIDQRLLPDDGTGLGSSIHDTRSFFAHSPFPGKLNATAQMRFGFSQVDDPSKQDGTLLTLFTKAVVQTRFFSDSTGKDVTIHTSHMSAEQPAHIKKDQLIRFRSLPKSSEDPLIQTWKKREGLFTGHGSLYDMVVFVDKSERADQFKLCVAATGETMIRSTCSVWQVPAAWHKGKPLTYKGQDAWDHQTLPYEDCPPPNSSASCTTRHYRTDRFFKTVKDDAPYSQFGLPPIVNQYP